MIKALFASALFVVFYNFFFYPAVLGIGFTLFVVVAHLVLFSLRDKDSKNVWFAAFLSVLSVFFAGFVAIRANEVIQFVDILTVLFLTGAAAFYYKQKAIFSSGLFSFFLSPLKAIAAEWDSLVGIFSNDEVKSLTRKNSAVYSAIFVGVLIVIPILFILSVLLLAADPIFKTLAGNLSFSVSAQLAFSVIVFLIAFFWGMGKVADEKRREISDLTAEQGARFSISSLVVSGAVALLFAIFLSIQLRYLFLVVPETELEHLGINVETYSEYVRQGFFYLLVAGAIATTVVAYILSRLHRITTVHKKYLQAVVFLLSFETVLLLVSAGKRLLLYVDGHGLSHIRIYGAFFLVWLALILVVIAIMTLWKIRARYAFSALFMVTLVTLLGLNLIPIDRLIALHYPPTVNDEVDTWYVAKLPPEAADAWVPIISDIKEGVGRLSLVQRPTDEDRRIAYELSQTLYVLQGHVYRLDRKYSTEDYIPVSDEQTHAQFQKPTVSWQAFNWSEYEAHNTIQDNRTAFEQLKPINELLSQTQKRWRELPPLPTLIPPVSQ